MFEGILAARSRVPYVTVKIKLLFQRFIYVKN